MKNVIIELWKLTIIIYVKSPYLRTKWVWKNFKSWYPDQFSSSQNKIKLENRSCYVLITWCKNWKKMKTTQHLITWEFSCMKTPQKHIEGVISSCNHLMFIHEQLVIFCASNVVGIYYLVPTSFSTSMPSKKHSFHTSTTENGRFNKWSWKLQYILEEDWGKKVGVNNNWQI